MRHMLFLSFIFLIMSMPLPVAMAGDGVGIVRRDECLFAGHLQVRMPEGFYCVQSQDTVAVKKDVAMERNGVSIDVNNGADPLRFIMNYKRGKVDGITYEGSVKTLCCGTPCYKVDLRHEDETRITKVVILPERNLRVMYVGAEDAYPDYAWVFEAVTGEPGCSQ